MYRVLDLAVGHLFLCARYQSIFYFLSILYYHDTLSTIHSFNC